MKKFTIVVVAGVAGLLVALLAMNLLTGSPPTASAQPPGPSQMMTQSDHVLADPPDDTAYCGVATATAPEPWILSVAAGNNAGTAATLKLEGQDGDSTVYPIPANSSFSFTLTFGGVPGVDHLVRITGTGDSVNFTAFVTAWAGHVARDPFDGDSEIDNFCVSIADEGPVSTTLPVPASWVDGFGNLQ